MNNIYLNKQQIKNNTNLNEDPKRNKFGRSYKSTGLKINNYNKQFISDSENNIITKKQVKNDDEIVTTD